MHKISMILAATTLAAAYAFAAIICCTAMTITCIATIALPQNQPKGV